MSLFNFSSCSSSSLRQVKLELIRQAESFEQVKEILEEQVGEAGSSSADPSWASEVYRDQNTASPNGTKKTKANVPSVLDPAVVVGDHVLLCYETLSSTKVVSDGQWTLATRLSFNPVTVSPAANTRVNVLSR